MDVSQSSTLVKFIEKKDFKMAYKLACLGVTDNDIRMLGTEALQNNDFEIAEKVLPHLILVLYQAKGHSICGALQEIL